MKRIGILAVTALAIVVAGGIIIGLNAKDDKMEPLPPITSVGTPTAATPAPVTGEAQKPAPMPDPTKPPANPEFAKEQKDDIVFGNSDAKVTITEYASLSCSHCADFSLNAYPEIEKNYIDTGKAKLVFRHFPLNAPALRAAQLVDCAPKDQKKKLINTLFRTQNKWAFDKDYQLHLQQMAILFGMDKDSFEKCMADKKGEEAVLKERQDGNKELNVNATPSIYINGERFLKAHDAATVSKAIDTVLEGKKLSDQPADAPAAASAPATPSAEEKK